METPQKVSSFLSQALDKKKKQARFLEKDDSSLWNNADDEIDSLEKHYTLHHTPILSDDMEIFSHMNERKEAKKWKRKKAFIAYIIGGVTIFFLSFFGFLFSDYGQSHISNPLYASITNKFTNLEECILLTVHKDQSLETQKLQKDYCVNLFEQTTNSSH